MLTGNGSVCEDGIQSVWRRCICMMHHTYVQVAIRYVPMVVLWVAYVRVYMVTVVAPSQTYLIVNSKHFIITACATTCGQNLRQPVSGLCPAVNKRSSNTTVRGTAGGADVARVFHFHTQAFAPEAPLYCTTQLVSRYTTVAVKSHILST